METVPYHFRSYKDGTYSFTEHETMESATNSIDFSRIHENNLVENLLVWGSPGREGSGYITDADYESPVPGGFKTAIWVMTAAALLIGVMVVLSIWTGKTP